MRRPARQLRDARLTLTQLALVGGVSAAVSALIVVSALRETAPERAIIAALRTRQLVHAAGPVPVRNTESRPLPPQASVPTRAIDTGPSAPSTSTAATATDGGSNSGAGSTTSVVSTGASSSGTGGSSGSGGSGTGAASSNPGGNQAGGPASKVKHIFVITLSTPSYAIAFGAGSAARYLNSTLRPKGELLTHYHSLRGVPLPDDIAMVSGQAPNQDTTEGCATYTDFPTGTTPASDGLVPGAGCVYPNTALTIGDQLDSTGLRWRAYIEGMSAPCQHPDSGAANVTAGDYSSTQNPFVYFHSLLDLGDCQSDDLPYARLPNALRSSSRTPSYVFISPDLCDSGATVTCPAGQPGGITAGDDFLRRAVPSILASPAYRTSGLLLIVFTATPPPAGQNGGAPVSVGALVLSPFTRPGTTDATTYSPYAILRSVEDIFGLPALGHAKTAHGFERKVLSRSGG